MPEFSRQASDLIVFEIWADDQVPAVRPQFFEVTRGKRNQSGSLVTWLSECKRRPDGTLIARRVILDRKRWCELQSGQWIPIEV